MSHHTGQQLARRQGDIHAERYGQAPCSAAPSAHNPAPPLVSVLVTDYRRHGPKGPPSGRGPEPIAVRLTRRVTRGQVVEPAHAVGQPTFSEALGPQSPVLGDDPVEPAAESGPVR